MHWWASPKKIFYHRHLIGYSRNSKDLPFSTQWKEGDTYYFRLFLFSIAEIYQHFAKKKSQSYLFLKMYRGIYYIYYTFQKTALLLLQTYYIYVNYAHNYEFMILLKQKWLAATAGVFFYAHVLRSHTCTSKG